MWCSPLVYTLLGENNRAHSLSRTGTLIFIIITCRVRWPVYLITQQKRKQPERPFSFFFSCRMYVCNHPNGAVQPIHRRWSRRRWRRETSSCCTSRGRWLAGCRQLRRTRGNWTWRLWTSTLRCSSHTPVCSASLASALLMQWPQDHGLCWHVCLVPQRTAGKSLYLFGSHSWKA